MRMSQTTERGFTVIELVIIIVIIGILATIATRQMQPSIETAKFEQTKLEMDQLVFAIAGNPEVRSNGARTDYGYVGDVGSLPPTLDALVTNPGGFTTWHGPYVEPGINGWEFKRDAWGSDYVLAGTVLRSVGSGQTIEKVICPQAGELISNQVRGVLLNADGAMPGTARADSIAVRLLYPDGAGGLTSALRTPEADGSFAFSNIPVGNHLLEVIYLPTGDTLALRIGVQPGAPTYVEMISPIDLW